MRGCFVVAAIVLQLTVVAGRQSESVPPGTATIEGRVVAAETKQPLADVIVMLSRISGPGVLTTMTDREGRYLFVGIGAGPYRVSAFLDGYARPAAPGRSFSPVPGTAIVAVDHGDVGRAVDLALVPGGTIAGRIIQADGKPVKDGLVLAALVDDSGGLSFKGVAEVRSNERGEYSIESAQWNVSGLGQVVRSRAVACQSIR